jgi:hypothetical protein
MRPGRMLLDAAVALRSIALELEQRPAPAWPRLAALERHAREAAEAVLVARACLPSGPPAPLPPLSSLQMEYRSQAPAPGESLPFAAKVLRAVAQVIEQSPPPTRSELGALVRRVREAAAHIGEARSAMAGHNRPELRQPVPSNSATAAAKRYYVHGDRADTGEALYYCAAGDFFAVASHFKPALDGSTEEHARRVRDGVWKLSLHLSAGDAVFRPHDAENLFDVAAMRGAAA